MTAATTALVGSVVAQPLPPLVAVTLPNDLDSENIAEVTSSTNKNSEETFFFVPGAAPQIQKIGRVVTAGTDLMFDMPGIDLRANFDLDAEATITAVIGQRNLPPPPNPQGNSKNSGFQENAFVVYVDGTRQGAGGWNASIATSSAMMDGQVYEFNLTNGGAALSKGPSCVAHEMMEQPQSKPMSLVITRSSIMHSVPTLLFLTFLVVFKIKQPAVAVVMTL